MIKVKNTSDQPQALWWGHTAFDINPGEEMLIEAVIIQACLKHPEYRPLFDSGTITIVEGKEELGEMPPTPEPSKPLETPTGNPWEREGEEWDAMKAPLAEVIDYVRAKDLKVDITMPEIPLREIADEHYLSND